jgi:hypothetical protein
MIKRAILTILGVIMSVLVFSGLVDAGIAPLNGDVASVRSGAIEWVIRDAISGHSGTQIFVKGAETVYARSYHDGWIFVFSQHVSDCPKQLADAAKRGFFVSTKTFKEVVEFMKRFGWETIPATALKNPKEFLAALSGNNLTLYVIPVGALSFSQNIIEDMYPVMEE